MVSLAKWSRWLAKKAKKFSRWLAKIVKMDQLNAKWSRWIS